MDIALNEKRLNVAKNKIRTYFETELEEPIGDLKAELILDFFIRELGPSIYNQAIEDAQTFMQDKLLDLESTLYVPE